MSELFRENALERVSSPEQLHQAVVITSPAFWLALAGGILMGAAALLWGFFGKVPVCVDTRGIYLAEQNGPEREAVCYVPLEAGKRVEPGMQVMVYPSTVNRQEYGHMEGTVASVAPYVTTREEAGKRLKDETLVQYFFDQGPVVEVVCSLRQDTNTESSYYWSGRKGGKISIREGTLLSASIITERKTPVSMLIPGD